MLHEINRFNVHTKLSPELTAEVQQLEAAIETAEKADGQSFLKNYAREYHQLAIYYGFAKRDQALARKYAEKSKASCDANTFEYGIACNFVGYANFMTGGDSNPAPFVEALSVFKNLNEVDPVLLNINQGFAHRYVGLAAHRKSMYAREATVSKEAHDEAVLHLNAAKELFEEAVKIQNETLASSFPLDLDLMETVHLLGVRHTRQKQYDEAINMLLEAIAIETAFNDKTKAEHFLTYISLQSLGEAYLLSGDNDTALHTLNDTLNGNDIFKGQIKFYGKREHADIAKTLHFIGMARANKKEWALACEALQEALAIKVNTLKPGDQMIRVTEMELLKAFNAHFDFDWNNHITIETSKLKIKAIEAFLTNFDYDSLDYIQLQYKLGTFYIHVKGQSDLAMAHLKSIKDAQAGDDLLWTLNHIAYCHQKDAYNYNQLIKLDPSKEELQTQKDEAIQDALTITNTTINCHERNLSEKNLALVKIVAFAYAIKALTFYENSDLKKAIKAYEKSEELYRTYGLQYDGDQYARVVNRLAMMYEENHQLNRAKQCYEFLVEYWEKQIKAREENPKLPQNVYEPRFHDTYATFLENTGDLIGALAQVSAALAIREITEEKTSRFLIQNQKREAALRAEVEKLVEENPAIYRGSFYGANQPPRAASFAGTSVTMPLATTQATTSSDEKKEVSRPTV